MAASRSCHTQVRFSLMWLPGDSALTERRTDCYPEKQCGFRPDRSTMDTMFVVRRLQKIGRRAGVSLLMCFIDLQKAYDTVDRTLLWQVLTRIGEPVLIIAVTRNFLDEMRACVRPNGGV